MNTNSPRSMLTPTSRSVGTSGEKYLYTFSSTRMGLSACVGSGRAPARKNANGRTTRRAPLLSFRVRWAMHEGVPGRCAGDQKNGGLELLQPPVDVDVVVVVVLVVDV